MWAQFEVDEQAYRDRRSNKRERVDEGLRHRSR